MYTYTIKLANKDTGALAFITVTANSKQSARAKAIRCNPNYVIKGR